MANFEWGQPIQFTRAAGKLEPEALLENEIDCSCLETASSILNSRKQLEQIKSNFNAGLRNLFGQTNEEGSTKDTRNLNAHRQASILPNSGLVTLTAGKWNRPSENGRGHDDYFETVHGEKPKNRTSAEHWYSREIPTPPRTDIGESMELDATISHGKRWPKNILNRNEKSTQDFLTISLWRESNLREWRKIEIGHSVTISSEDRNFPVRD